MKSIPPPKKKEKESQDDPAPREEKCSYPPREESSSYASSEELSVHNESLDKKRSIDQPPVSEKICPGRKEIRQKDEEDPREGSRSQEGSKRPKCARGIARSRSSRRRISRQRCQDPCQEPTWIGSPSQSYFVDACLPTSVAGPPCG